MEKGGATHEKRQTVRESGPFFGLYIFIENKDWGVAKERI
jgi:hypothetical protein